MATKNLTLSIKQEFFDQIKAGTKTFEEREIRPNNVKRYCEVDSEGYVVDDRLGNPKTRDYDTITFLTGAYKGTRPKIVVQVKKSQVIILTDKNGKDLTYTQNGKTYIVSVIRYELGKILEV